MRFRFVGRVAGAAILAACLAGCGTVGGWFGNDDPGKLDSRPPDVIYKEAQENMDKGSSNKAAEAFERIRPALPIFRRS